MTERATTYGIDRGFAFVTNVTYTHVDSPREIFDSRGTSTQPIPSITRRVKTRHCLRDTSVR